MTSRLRATLWAIAVGVLSVAIAVALFRMVPGRGVVFLLLLLLSVAFVSALAGALADIAPPTGAAAGTFAAVLVAATLGVTISIAPLQPGAPRPRFSDLLWMPLFVLVISIALCAVAGWSGARIGLRFASRRKR